MGAIDKSTSVGRREVLRAFRALSTTLHPRRLALLRDLRRGLDAGELGLVYQPKLDLRTQDVIGCEALIRWEHPRRGTLAPGEFLPAAEGSTVMTDITRHVLTAALTEQGRWTRAGVGVSVQVNLAARDIIDPGLGASIGRTLAQSGAPGAALGVEITENDLLEDPSQATATVLELKGMGVAVALDDFGTGYSSLSRLKQLPFDEVKIDRSFVGSMLDDRGSHSIVRATIDLAHDFGTTVVAEGVEDEATADALRSLGCDCAQGFGLARPMPAPQTRAWLRGRGEAVVLAAA